MLNSKLKSNVTAKQKKEIWADIVNAVNAVGGYGRTVEEVTHTCKWKDLKARAKNDISNRKRVPTGGGPKKTQSPYTDIVLDIIGEDNPILAGLASAEAKTEFMRGFQEGLGRDQDETTDSMASSTLSQVASPTDCLSYKVSRSCTPSNSRTSSPAPAVRMPSPAPTSRTPSPAPTATSATPKTVERKKTTGPKKKSGYVSTEKTREELHKELLVLDLEKS